MGGVQEVRTGNLIPEAHALLLQGGMDYIKGANAALDELYEICCPIDSRLTKAFCKRTDLPYELVCPLLTSRPKQASPNARACYTSMTLVFSGMRTIRSFTDSVR